MWSRVCVERSQARRIAGSVGKTAALCGVLVAAPVFSASAAARPCEAVASDTVAEMRAGASSNWNAELEQLVRAAAGAACVKALSGRYGSDNAVAGADAGMRSGAVAASEGKGEGASQGSAGQNSGQGESDAAENDDGSFSIGGITIRGQSGASHKKPYQRTREGRDEE